MSDNTKEAWPVNGLKRFIGSPAHNVETLRADLASFVFLLGGNDGEHFTSSGGNLL